LLAISLRSPANRIFAKFLFLRRAQGLPSFLRCRKPDPSYLAQVILSPSLLPFVVFFPSRFKDSFLFPPLLVRRSSSLFACPKQVCHRDLFLVFFSVIAAHVRQSLLSLDIRLCPRLGRFFIFSLPLYRFSQLPLSAPLLFFCLVEFDWRETPFPPSFLPAAARGPELPEAFPSLTVKGVSAFPSDPPSTSVQEGPGRFAHPTANGLFPRYVMLALSFFWVHCLV